MDELTLQEVENVAKRAAAGHGVSEMYVYGSVAKGVAGPDSDVDLIYRLAPEKKATAGVIMSLKDELEKGLGRPVSLLSMRAFEFNARLSPSGKRFYDAVEHDLKRVV
ncbi:MAG: nucleotidyltransferase domain-containing protein [Bifidobacterium sp.]|jgi:predicted nucleotidyltransferase|nr:nucleotidyltransferase domain-containing protein [Bifidobacterium sp.]